MPAKESSKEPAKTFQALSAELDNVLAQLQQSELPVDDALALYKKGLDTAKELEHLLTAAENKLTALTPSRKK